jgi:hypothetical protein
MLQSLPLVENPDRIFIMTHTLTVLLMIAFVVIPIQRSYRGVVPLESTRLDVEKLLGKPSDPYRGIYNFGDEIVSFVYSKHGCTPATKVDGWPIPPVEGWNVPADTVLFVNVNLRKQIPLHSLGIDLKNFKKVRGDSDIPSHFKYVDEAAGFTIDLNGDGGSETVRGYIYGPAAKYNHLRCPEVK